MTSRMMQAAVLAAVCAMAGAVTLAPADLPESILAETQKHGHVQRSVATLKKKCGAHGCATDEIMDLGWNRKHMGERIHANVDIIAPSVD